MHILRLIVAGAGIISALLFLPTLVLFVTTAYPPVRTRSACRLASVLATRSTVGLASLSPAGQAAGPDPSGDAANVAQVVRSSAKAQLRLLKLVELGLRAPRVDQIDDRH